MVYIILFIDVFTFFITSLFSFLFWQQSFKRCRPYLRKIKNYTIFNYLSIWFIDVNENRYFHKQWFAIELEFNKNRLTTPSESVIHTKPWFALNFLCLKYIYIPSFLRKIKYRINCNWSFIFYYGNISVFYT